MRPEIINNVETISRYITKSSPETYEIWKEIFDYIKMLENKNEKLKNDIKGFEICGICKNFDDISFECRADNNNIEERSFSSFCNINKWSYYRKCLEY